VPNHMLEQFSREFLTLYPDADILVTTKQDLQKENRKLFTAKAATGDWDAIIMTHSSFNKVGMSPQYQEAFIQKEIESYEELLDYAHTQNGSNRRFIKDIETAKQNLENKLDTVVGQNARSKDQHIFFEELGVDHIFIDEAHAFKNLQIQTKMDRIAGLNTTGSARSLNLFMITEYLNEQDQAGITFATATPITNSLSEMYTMMRYLIPDQMEEMGIQHFDAWAAAFGEVVTRLEIKPDASTIDFQSRFAKFHNVPELLQLFNLATDVKRQEELQLPVPEARYETITAEPSKELLEFQQQLQSRYQKVRNGSVDPKDDNALKISTEGRKAALDIRLVNPFAFDNPGSKVNQLVDKVYHIWEKNTESKATQMIFSDIGVHGKGGSLSVYEDIIDKLAQRGIPREQLANINDYGTDVKKAALFEKMRRGEVRVLIGSTQKMGTGTNVQSGTIINGKMQGGLIALHHLDAPWRPADMEQRDGRIIRQGNPFNEIDIYRYITQQSFDAVMWQKLEQKQHFISQIMTNSLTERTIDDVGSEEALAFAEVAAIASGNPEILELAEVEAQIRSLSLQEEAYQQKITRAKREQSSIPGKLYRYEQNKAGINRLIQERDSHLSRQPADKEEMDITINFKHPENRKEANILLKTQIGSMYAYQHKQLATVQGLQIYVERFG
ncbi:MAG: helicase, partial [Bacteroidetes bacterium]|nr:helicase [Bacteroidota bacterium]